jgi:2-polyprenyl-3-methyl-5-hydroxy-6-metoxy-1,4-benzoquinol methylase
MLNDNDLYDYYLEEMNTKFEGWDFSHIRGRMQEFPLTWNYRAIIIPYLTSTTSLLDMGTGGGEFLSSIPFPKNTHATEAYEPNVKIAKNRLEPLGIKVKHNFSDSKLPFDNEQFDIIINRHESYDESEVYRIIKRGGHFITQQVGCSNNMEINHVLEAPNPDDYDENWTIVFLKNKLVKK